MKNCSDTQKDLIENNKKSINADCYTVISEETHEDNIDEWGYMLATGR